MHEFLFSIDPNTVYDTLVQIQNADIPIQKDK